MKLLGYIRVSTDEQAEKGKSISVQEMQLAKYCELYDHELVDVLLDDGISASVDLDRRPGGANLLMKLEDGLAQGVVIQRVDRGFRKTINGLVTAARFNACGWTIHSVNERIDTSTPDGWLQLTILLAMAEYERNKIVQRAHEISNGLRDQGIAWGHAPYGCIRVGDQIYRDPAKWSLRQRIIDLRMQGLSLRVIGRTLQRDGIRAPNGGRLWHLNTLTTILQSHDSLHHLPFLSDPSHDDGTGAAA